MVLNREPALIVGAVNALIALAVGFGLDIDPEQVGLINAAVAAVLSVVVRQQVSPVGREPSERGQANLAAIAWVLVIVFLAVLLARTL